MKIRIFKYLSILVLAFSLNMMSPAPLLAQCPMCRMSAESNLKDGGQAGRGLNSGILYMLATPYLLVGLIGFMWWRNRRKEYEMEEEISE